MKSATGILGENRNKAFIQVVSAKLLTPAVGGRRGGME